MVNRTGMRNAGTRSQVCTAALMLAFSHQLLAAGAESGAAPSSQAAAGQAAVMQAPEGTLEGGYKASEWLGKGVKNLKGEDLGEVEDLVLTPMGRVIYVILSHGGFLGLGEDELVVAPWSAMVPAANREYLVLDVSKERMEEAPRFKKTQWPNLWDPEWNALVVTFYEIEPIGQQALAYGFNELDTDSNDEITQAEAEKSSLLSSHFEQVDNDRDGQINRSEFGAFEMQIAEQPATESKKKATKKEASSPSNHL